MFVWNYGWFENDQTLMLDMLSMVFHLQINMQTIVPSMTRERVWLRIFFMDDYLFFKSPLLFFHSVLALPYYCLDI